MNIFLSTVSCSSLDSNGKMSDAWGSSVRKNGCVVERRKRGEVGITNSVFDVLAWPE
jgi:hypothetical protein